MKNARAKTKDGKTRKKLRVAKFKFCTMGMPAPFQNSMNFYDYNQQINNNIFSLNISSQNSFSTFPCGLQNQFIQNSASSQQFSPKNFDSAQSQNKSCKPSQFNFFSLKSDESHDDELNLNVNQHQNQLSKFIDFSGSKSKSDDKNAKFCLSKFPELTSFTDIYPSSFDIVKRGPLPSILIRTNGEIEFYNY